MVAHLAALVLLGASNPSWWVVQRVSVTDDLVRKDVALHFTADEVDVVAKGAVDERLSCSSDGATTTCGTRELSLQRDGDKATLSNGFRGVGQISSAELRRATASETESWNKLLAAAPSIADACAQAHACAVQGRKKAKIGDARYEVGKTATWRRCVDAKRALVAAIQERKKKLPPACRDAK
ncbi:MAG: hypothetical protein JST54_04135 [Deltaproteobacteria bacterium]|nr:hypothetical protein [Deltaproteobacteria bacterium]